MHLHNSIVHSVFLGKTSQKVSSKDFLATLVMSSRPPEGVLEVILTNCRSYAEKPALHWLSKDGEVVETLTYRDIEERTHRTAKGLLDLMKHYELAEGRHCVVLCYPPGLEFILTFIACLRAGLIAVPVCPPSKHQSAYTTATLNNIITDCGAVFGLTNKEFCEEPSIAQLMGTTTIPWHCELVLENEPNEEGLPLNEAEGEEGILDKTAAKDVILLQYTSGSTGNPKGVINTNECVLHNLELVKHITKSSEHMIELSFLPHYHDFGLFCSYLQVLYCGATGYYMSPTAFIEEPGRLISCLAKYRATHSQAPNFALELLLRKGFPKDVDLSAMQYLSNGSEPVYPDTIERFESEMAPLGLRKNTVRAAYGLAEHTVYLCGVMDGEDPLVIDGRIGCGKMAPGVTVKVVNPESRTEVKEGEEGEVWVDSGSKASGYWKKPQETHTTFEAKLADDPGRLYLRTGDLGFMVEEELFISGRVKDVIVMYGRKIHPSDIEMSMESQFDLLRPGRTVACEYSGEELDNVGVAYIAEIRSKAHNLVDLEAYSIQIAANISMQFQVNTTLVVLIKAGSMPRTTSGKRQRSLCKQKLLKNSLPEIIRWSPSSDENLCSSTSPLPDPDGTAQAHLTSDATLVSPALETTQPVKTAFLEKEDTWKQEPDLTSLKQINFDGFEGTKTSEALLSPRFPMQKTPPNPKIRRRISSSDMIKQFNFEMGDFDLTKLESHRTSGPASDTRRTSVTALVPPPVVEIKVEDLVVPEITDPDTCSPEAKVRRGSRIIPAITMTSPDISVKTFSREPRLSSDPSSLLSVNRRDSPRRKSAPPHAVDMEERRIEDDARRPSVQDRKALLHRKERRNSISTLTRSISKVLGVELEPSSNIWAHGCNSLKAVQLSKSLQVDFGFSIEPHLLFTHQTPASLLENFQRTLLNMPLHPEIPKSKSVERWKTQSLDRNISRRRSSFGLLTEVRRMSLPRIYSEDGSSTTASSRKTSVASETGSEVLDTDIAIVGMACSFAGCENTEELWQLLMSKQVVTSSHQDPSSHNSYNGGFSMSTSRFDHHYFGISEWEASSLDPQHSMLLHTVWECLHNSGYSNPMQEIRGSEWGVYVGISLDCDAHFLSSEEGSIPPATSITSSVAANRIARTFDLTGPSMSIDTACASSLSALHTACMSIRMGDCPAALVCGVNAMLDKNRFEILDNMGMLAPDERCKVFDKKANGYVRGEGSGAVLLMPLWKARREDKRVLSVIKSTATNNNGAASSTITAPHTGIQAKVLNKALAKSKMKSTSIHYVEAHGTGTRLGDPIEVDAIQNVLGEKEPSLIKGPESRKDVYVGSVKANIGHLETGAGIAGLIKTVLVLEHTQIPGNPCLEELNPAFKLSKNIQIPADNVMGAFDTSEKACAIVNSFGFGGTNATAVLQQFDTLPHMANVTCGVLFLNESTSEDLENTLKAILKLSEAFPTFKQALSKMHMDKVELTQEMAIFQLLYGVSSVLLSLDTAFNIIGGIDILGEILALCVADAIEVSQAIDFIGSYKSGNYPSLDKIKTSILRPSTPIFSCMLEKVCNPTQYMEELKSEKYAQEFLKMLQGATKNKSHVQTKALIMMSSQTIYTHPLLMLTLGDLPSQMSEIERSLQDNTTVMNMSQKEGIDLEQYLREECLKLRALNDKLDLKACSKKPLKGPENVLPRFYERYPLRALVETPKPSQKSSTYSDIVNESGYLTQTTSTESLQTPTKTMAKAPPPSPSSLGIKLGMSSKVKGALTESCIKALWKKEAICVESTELETSETVECKHPDSKEADPRPEADSNCSQGTKSSPQAEPDSQFGEMEKSEGGSKQEPKVPEPDFRQVDEPDSKSGMDPDMQKKEVLRAIRKHIEDELEDTDMPLEELAASGIFELGLDSLNVMQLSDFFRKTYNVRFTFSELTELETMGEVSSAVVKNSSVLRGSATQTPS